MVLNEETHKLHMHDIEYKMIEHCKSEKIIECHALDAGNIFCIGFDWLTKFILWRKPNCRLSGNRRGFQRDKTA